MHPLKRLLFSVLSFVVVSNGFTQVENQNISGRNYEAVVVRASTLQSFHGLAITNLYLYAYDDNASDWRAVPFQIDERSSNGNYFDNDDGLLDEYDELVFMIKDMGDRVPDGFWTGNAESKERPRFEIEAEDTYREGRKAWAYLIYSSTITDFNFENYLSYDEAEDRVNSKFYQVGFDDSRGLPNWYSVTEEAGGTNQDILDRMKVRIEVSTNIIGNVSITEDNFIKEEISPFPNSQVRFVRNMRTRLRVVVSIPPFPPYEVVNEDSIFIPIYCYPYYLNVASDAIGLDLGSLPGGITATLKVIRNSQDFNSNAVNMYFYNPFNTETSGANLIDGVGDSTGIDRSLVAPGLNWNMLTGSPGTLLVLNFVPLLGDKQELYFWDRLQGGTMDQVNGNGDFTTFGDHGFLLTGESITGSFRLLNFTYLLPPLEHIVLSGLEEISSPAEIGEIFRQNLQYPVQINVLEQPFDIIPPQSVQDLRVISSTDSSLTVGWTSPGDDGASGIAQIYDLRLSTQEPTMGSLEEWFSAAREVDNLDSPQPGGMQESVVIHGLDPDSVYYLAVKTRDEAGNESDISNVVSEIILSVDIAGPGDYALSQNYPNPFNPTTTIDYQIVSQEHVLLKIYNLAGQLMATPVDEIKPPGRYRIEIDASDWPSGIYFARLSTGSGQLTRKMLLMR